MTGDQMSCHGPIFRPLSEPTELLDPSTEA